MWPVFGSSDPMKSTEGRASRSTSFPSVFNGGLSVAFRTSSYAECEMYDQVRSVQAPQNLLAMTSFFSSGTGYTVVYRDTTRLVVTHEEPYDRIHSTYLEWHWVSFLQFDPFENGAGKPAIQQRYLLMSVYLSNKESLVITERKIDESSHLECENSPRSSKYTIGIVNHDMILRKYPMFSCEVCKSLRARKHQLVSLWMAVYAIDQVSPSK